MALKPHEKWIKDQFREEESLINTSEVWESVEAFVPKNKKRRFFLWIPLAFIFLLLSGFAFWNLQENRFEMAEIPVSPIDDELDKNKTLVQEEEKDKETQEEYIPSRKEDKVEKSQVEINQSGDDQENALTPLYSIAPQGIIQETKQDKVESTESKIVIDSKISPALSHSNMDNDIPNEPMVQFSAQVLIDSDQIKSQDLLKLKEPIANLEMKKNPALHTITEPISKWEINYRGGINYESQVFNNSSSENNIDYNAITSNLPSYSLGLDISRKISQTFLVNAGLQWRQGVTRYSGEFLAREIEEQYQIYQYIIDTEGNLVSNFSSIDQIKETITKGRWHLKTQTAQLHLGGIYEARIQGRWQARLGFGIALDVLERQRGFILGESLKLEERDPEVSIISNPTIFFNPLLVYRIHPRWKIGLGIRHFQGNNENKLTDFVNYKTHINQFEIQLIQQL